MAYRFDPKQYKEKVSGLDAAIAVAAVCKKSGGWGVEFDAMSEQKYIVRMIVEACGTLGPWTLTIKERKEGEWQEVYQGIPPADFWDRHAEDIYREAQRKLLSYYAKEHFGTGPVDVPEFTPEDLALVTGQKENA